MLLDFFKPKNGPPNELLGYMVVTIYIYILSGTESAILNRESDDSDSCDSNRAIPRSP